MAITMLKFTLESWKDDFIYNGWALKPYHDFGDIKWYVVTNEEYVYFAYFHEACEYIDDVLNMEKTDADDVNSST